MYPLSYLFGLKRFRNGAWFEPSTPKQIDDAITLLDLHPHDRVAELGSGDGSAVLAIARHKISVMGFEKDQRLVDLTTGLIEKEKLGKFARIVRGDFWQEDLSRFNKIYVYQFKTVMPRLEKKLKDELPKGSLVASNTWRFSRNMVKSLGDIHLYRF